MIKHDVQILLQIPDSDVEDTLLQTSLKIAIGSPSDKKYNHLYMRSAKTSIPFLNFGYNLGLWNYTLSNMYNAIVVVSSTYNSVGIRTIYVHNADNESHNQLYQIQQHLLCTNFEFVNLRCDQRRIDLYNKNYEKIFENQKRKYMVEDLVELANVAWTSDKVRPITDRVALSFPVNFQV